MRIWSAALYLCSVPVLAQKPIIDAVTNAATFAPANVTGHALAPGSIGTIFGRNLSASALIADSVPLPTSLGGTSVTVNGVPAPLFYVSPTQINFQVPSSTKTGSDNPSSSEPYVQASIVATTPAGPSDAAMADTAARSLGIWTMTGTGCGQAAVLNVKADGTVSVNSPAHSVSPGEYISIYGTGLGAVYNPPPDGTPAPAEPLAPARSGTGAWLEGEHAGGTFGGRAPGGIGVDQINLRIPPDARQGCAVPLQIIGFRSMSQPALLSIRTGGGQCVDPPIASGGEIVLEKSVVLNDSTIPESNTLTAVFSASPGKQLRLPPVIGPTTRTYEESYEHPPCPITGYSTLNAGSLALSGPGNLSLSVPPSIKGNDVSYQAALPAGAVQPGAFRLSSAGGPDAGAFETTLNVGSPIQITSRFPRGTGFGFTDPPFTVNWTGGQPGQTVTLKVRGRLFHAEYVAMVQAPATSGSISSLGLSNGQPLVQVWLSLPISDDVELDIEVSPDVAQPQIISIPGLTLGAVVNWKYVYRFIGLHVS